MKIKIFFFLLLLSYSFLKAQPQITIKDCQKESQQNYPLINKYSLIDKSLEYDLSNASKGYLPQFSLSGKATYQSDVTKSPIQLPNVKIDSAPKDQYQIILEVNQTIWDGGNIHSKKGIERAKANVESKKNSVEMYALNNRINQIYFGILLLDEQLKQNKILADELKRIYTKVSHYINNGIANQSDLDEVSVEQLDAKQKRIDLETLRNSYLNMLSAFIGRNISENTILIKPEPENITNNFKTADANIFLNNRPELNMFNAQKEQLKIEESALNNSLKPYFGLFIQGGYGNPGLNMLQDKFNTFYVAGVKMAWNFGSLYTIKNDKSRINNMRNEIDNAQDVFLFNNNLDAIKENAQITSMKKQMLDDDKIIKLRENIRKASEAKVENGTLTVTDMLSDVSKENLSKQTKNIHEIQLLMYEYQLKHTLNQ